MDPIYKKKPVFEMIDPAMLPDYSRMQDGRDRRRKRREKERQQRKLNRKTCK